MVDAALQFIRNGLRIALHSCATLLSSMVGINPRYSLTASTTTEGTYPAIFDLSRAVRTRKTSVPIVHAQSKNSNSALPFLKQRMQTYDIAYAGPRNRYTILTDDGPLIVHNCGYQLGWSAFAAQLLVGFLGAPPVRYTRAVAKKLGVDGDYLSRFLNREENLERLSNIPHTCSEIELVEHCVAAKKIIDNYRETAHPVTSFWELCSSLIQSALADGEEHTHKCLTFRKEEIVLPNGMAIRYPNLRQEKTADGGRSWVYGPDATKLYAGKITNNVVQGTARIVMTDGMLRIAKRYPVVGTVHDECIAVAPDAEAQEAFDWMLEQMTLEPSYLPGIPLAADGGVHRRYGSAKQ